MYIKRKLIDTLFSLVSINILLAGLSFITTWMIANVLGKERFGDLSYAIAIGGYCVTIAYCGLERTFTRDLVHFPKRFNEYVSASILLRGVMLVLGSSVILGVNAFAGAENRLGFAGVLIVLTLGTKALGIASIYDAWDKMKRHAIYYFIERCLYFALIWLTVFLFKKESISIPAIAIFMIASTALGLALEYRWAIPRLNIRLDCKSMLFAASMLKKNLWIWSAILATLSFGGLSKIALKHVSGSGELGEYAVAWQVVLLGSILIAQVGRIGTPRMARIVQPDISQVQRLRFLIKYTALLTLAGAIIGVPAICFPETILRIFRPEYASAATSLRILGVYVIFVGIGQVTPQYLIAVHREIVYSVVIIFTGGLSVFLYAIWIPRWSAAGAALSVLLAHGTAIIIYLVAMTHHLLNHYERKPTIS
ncbi:MAG: oligosaccharide flippase family protein [Anaerolineae bacterium]|nr:oligosaccharide flippase family protein [Anaerolineae bacterium]